MSEQIYCRDFHELFLKLLIIKYSNANLIYIFRLVHLEDGQHNCHIEKTKTDFYNSNTLKFLMESNE